MDCIFCKIVSHNIPNYTILENEAVLAFLDINPQAKGHTVVIPKAHADSVFALEPGALQALALGVKETMGRLKERLAPDGFNAGWNDGEAAGQAVPHVHIHVLPRWTGDGGGSLHSIVNRPGDLAVAEVWRLFKP